METHPDHSDIVRGDMVRSDIGETTAVKLLLLAVAAVCTAACAATAVNAENENAELLRHGEQLITKECARCHGVGRTDASKHPQAPLFRKLSKRYPIESLEEALGEGIISGHPDMPEFQFDAEDVGAIIAYLKSIQEK
jgi:mono/diheme cytochrome c family protein